MNFSEYIKIHILKRLPAIITAVVVSALFFLYYIGVLDVSFIERPEEWTGHRVLFSELLSEHKEKPAKDPQITEKPEDTTAPDSEKDPTEDTTDTEETKKEPAKDEETTDEGDKKPPVQNYFEYPTVEELKADGYSLSDKIFDDTCLFAKLDTEYDLPREFSYSLKTYAAEKIIKYDDGTESKVEVKSKTEDRPAIELYMGYIIYDDNGVLYLINPDGGVMRQYNDREFIPAYTRDKEGRPLFYKNVTTTEKYPITLGEKNEDGEREWTKTGELSVKKKEYYYLSEDGKTFVKSDYCDITDNRGLYFDYPSYYGSFDPEYTKKIEADTSEGKINTQNLNVFRHFIKSTRFFTDTNGNTTMSEQANWTFASHSFKTEDYKFDPYGVLIPEKEDIEKEEEVKEDKKDKEDKDNKKDKKKKADTEKAEDTKEEPEEEAITIDKIFPYTAAYNYSKKYATVFKDIEWTYDHDVKNEEGKTEKKTFDVTTNELRVIDESGNIMFDSRKNYFSQSFNWSAHEKYSRPLLSGIESLGHYYFDHGLMRLRVQSWDCYQFAEYDMVRIVGDQDILVDPKGNQFYIPTGYRLVSYSDGILLLEKNGRYGYFNYLGAWIKDPKLTMAEPFLEGVAACRNDADKYGVIDRNGNTVIPFIYDYISNVSGGTIAAYLDGQGWTVYQKMSK